MKHSNLIIVACVLTIVALTGAATEAAGPKVKCPPCVQQKAQAAAAKQRAVAARQAAAAAKQQAAAAKRAAAQTKPKQAVCPTSPTRRPATPGITPGGQRRQTTMSTIPTRQF